MDVVRTCYKYYQGGAIPAALLIIVTNLGRLASVHLDEESIRNSDHDSSSG